MRPRPLMLVALPAAALSVMIAVGWAATYGRPAFLYAYGPHGESAAVGLGRGEVYATACNLPTGSVRAWTAGFYQPVDDDAVKAQYDLLDAPAIHHNLAGFAVGRATDLLGIAGTAYWVIAAPAWAVWSAVNVLPAWAAVRFTRDRRRRRTGGWCPECGAGAGG